jgi:hypothetical protein
MPRSGPFTPKRISDVPEFPYFTDVERFVKDRSSAGIIAKPLRPTNAPFEAADSLTAKIAADNPELKSLVPRIRNHVRLQVWRMSRNAVSSEGKNARLRDWDSISVEDWHALSAAAREAGVAWDEAGQEYKSGR